MNKKSNLFVLFSTIVFQCFSQSPRLSAVGSNFSFAKGNIDVEVLSEIIQQKQEEVSRRIFHNLIVKNFKNAEVSERSFATYNYVYNLIYTLTVEKNKTVITRQVINNLLEYAFVSEFAKQFLITLSNADLKTVQGSVTIDGSGLLDNLNSASKEISSHMLQLKNISDTEWKTFNLLLDMAFDIFKDDDVSKKLQDKGLFKLLNEKPNLKSWYNRYNAYVHRSSDQNVVMLREQMLIKFNEFINNPRLSGWGDLADIFVDLQKVDFQQESISEKQYEALKKILRSSAKILNNYSDNNLIGNLTEYLLDYTMIEFEVSNTRWPSQRKGIVYIDAEGLIANLYSKFSDSKRRSTLAYSSPWGFITPRPFVSIGTTYGTTLNSDNNLLTEDNGLSNLSNIYFANEKIGLKFTLMDKAYTHSFEPGEEFKFLGKKRYWIEPQKEPLITRMELLAYGSGLLYNIVDVKSQKNFDYALAGFALNFTFFNGLMFNSGFLLPFNASGDLKEKWMFTCSFDIPIVEYLSAVSKKRAK